MTGVYIHIRSLIVSLELMAISRLRGDSIIVCVCMCVCKSYMYFCMYEDIYIYIYVCVCIYLYICIFVYKLCITCMGDLRV